MSCSLSAGETILLPGGRSGPGRVVMGLGWDARRERGYLGLFGGASEIDLDASCVLLDAAGSIVDVVWFRQLRSKDGSVVHSGDNRTGEGDGDDERIVVELEAVPGHVGALVFLVTSFSGDDFCQIDNAFCRLVDAGSGRELARFELSCGGRHNAQVMAELRRLEDGWCMRAIGANARGETFRDLLPVIHRCVAV